VADTNTLTNNFEIIEGRFSEDPARIEIYSVKALRNGDSYRINILSNRNGAYRFQIISNEKLQVSSDYIYASDKHADSEASRLIKKIKKFKVI
jgi:hypothetical protein